jgi:translation initiation factor 2D
VSLAGSSVTVNRLSFELVIFFSFCRTEDSLHTSNQVRQLFDQYVTTHSLVHPREKQYIVLDDVLRNVLQQKGEELEFMTRSEAIEKLRKGMQPWHEMSFEGGETIVVCVSISSSRTN